MSKLEERRKQYGIPEAPCLPQGKKVICYRIPAAEEEKTKGGLYIPQTATTADDRGVLLAAGLLARDKMRDALIEIGDLVWLPPFATNTPSVDKTDTQSKHVVMLNIEDITGSVDGKERLEAEYDVVWNEKLGQHRYVKRGAKVESDDVIVETAKKTRRAA